MFVRFCHQEKWNMTISPSRRNTHPRGRGQRGRGREGGGRRGGRREAERRRERRAVLETAPVKATTER